jgi:8-oxo-dGTP diphosphatase
MPASDQGIFHDRYLLIPRVLIFLTRGREVLLIKGALTKRLWANLYNGIGGHVEQGEDIISAAHRELREETGISGVPLILSAIITIDTGENTGIGMYVFKGSIEEGKNPELISSIEGELEWVHQFDLVSLPLVEDLPALLPKVIAHKVTDPPVFGLYSYSSDGKLRIHFAK